MPRIFISHVNENSSIALAIAAGLEKAGYPTWYYERDCVIGDSYLAQIHKAVKDAPAVVLIISPESIDKAEISNQVTSEVVLGHETHKRFLPILFNISWPEFQRKQPEWRQALGATVGIQVTPENLDSVVEKIVAGLEHLNIPRGEISPAPPVESRYPFPLAVAHQRAAALQSAAEEGYAYHQSLQELAASLLQFASITALSAYFNSPHKNEASIRRIDAELFNAERPMYETWLAVLALTLESSEGSGDAVIQAIERFYQDKRTRKDPLGEAIIHLQHWIGLRARQRTLVSQEDLFGLLGYYLTHAQGWAAGSTGFPAAEFTQRAQVLYTALSTALEDLMSLGKWELSGAILDGGRLQPVHLMGLSPAPMPASARQPAELADQHVYLLHTLAGPAQPALDLFPWLSLNRCSGCGGLSVWAIASSPAATLQWVCQRCTTCHPLSDQALQELSRLLNRKISPPPTVEVKSVPDVPAPTPSEIPPVKEKVSLRFEVEMPLTHAWPIPGWRLLAWDKPSGSLSLVEEGRVIWRSPERFLLRFIRYAPDSALAAAWDGRLVIFYPDRAPIWMQADGTIGDACSLGARWVVGTWKKDLFSVGPDGDVERFPDVNEGVYRIAAMEQSGWLAVASLNGGIGLYQKDHKVLSIAPFDRLGSLAFTGPNLLVEAASRLHTLSLAGKETDVEALSPDCQYELVPLLASEDCLLICNHSDGKRIDRSGHQLKFFSLPRKSRLLAYCSRPGRILIAPESGGCALLEANKEVFTWEQGIRLTLSQDGSAAAAVSDDRAALYEVAV